MVSETVVNAIRARLQSKNKVAEDDADDEGDILIDAKHPFHYIP